MITKTDDKKLEVFERKIFGPKRNNEGKYEIRNYVTYLTLLGIEMRADRLGRTCMQILRTIWTNNCMETKRKETQTNMDRYNTRQPVDVASKE